jgi:hypothetical protein
MNMRCKTFDTSEDAVQRLEHWRPQIDRALRAGRTMAYEDVVNHVRSCHYLLFDNDSAFVVVEPQCHPKMIVLHVLVGGGTQTGLEALEDTVKIFGRLIGASKMTILGRPGFARRVVKQGWKQPMTYLEKEI